MLGDDDDQVNGGPELDEDITGTGGGAEGQDAGGGDDDPEVSAEHPDGEVPAGERGVDEESGRAPTRGETRFQRLANETKAARAEAAEARREAQELRRSQVQTSQHLTEQQERERLALMTPEERTGYQLDKMQRSTSQQLREMEFRTQNLTDKAAFDAKATIHPTYQKFQGPVEEKFQELLAKGTPTDRETILKFMLGERALAAANPAKARKVAQGGQNRIQAQATKPGTAKGDAASQRGKVADSAEKRLAGQFI